ncbi:hypothetical protein [Mesorhizobium sp. RMAD-H1]|uniref:hypothetical protein n=1 Tax=Mesorhizobium sp. RMAD-H1 TaxID=2587065 RepID=UPI0016123229|nr:hypothetical protein [Mesorhizobium sp. RMAD-H1]MBB2974382.1 hypothetical protein [Mesorhizobium sp. RMAD-H1]
MKPMSQLMAATMILLLSGGFAAAECVDTTTSAPDGTTTTGIAKDGSKAPLEKPDGEAAHAHADPNAVQKSGQTMPLADQQGGGNKDLATSQQDVQAQQEGDKTAAAKAEPRKNDACAE